MKLSRRNLFGGLFGAAAVAATAPSSKCEEYIRKLQSGEMTINQVRRAEGLDPIRGADTCHYHIDARGVDPAALESRIAKAVRAAHQSACKLEHPLSRDMARLKEIS